MSQLWSNTGQGYMASDILSEDWRTSLQPLTRFRQFCDVEVAVGKNAGEVYDWTVYGDTVDEGGAINETDKMPETSFPVSQGTVTLTEHGLAIPHSLKYESMSQHNVPKVISKTLRNNANRAFETLAHAQFDNTALIGVGATTTTLTVTDSTTTPGSNNNSNLLKAHVKLTRDEFEERNIPVFDGEDYVCIARPSTIRPMIDELESVHQYTDEGWKRIVNGERGRYEGVRFCTATHVSAGTNFATNGKSDWAFFFGADTVTEAISVPEELRGKIPDDYGRSKGIAWYYVGAFAITHADTTSAETRAQQRIMKWSSAA